MLWCSCFAAVVLVIVNQDRLRERVQATHGARPDTSRSCRSCLMLAPCPRPRRAQGVQGISDIITIPGLVNVDFADVKAIMCNSGTAMLGVGVSTGKNRAEEAALVRRSDTVLLLFLAEAVRAHPQARS